MCDEKVLHENGSKILDRFEAAILRVKLRKFGREFEFDGKYCSVEKARNFENYSEDVQQDVASYNPTQRKAT